MRAHGGSLDFVGTKVCCIFLCVSPFRGQSTLNQCGTIFAAGQQDKGGTAGQGRNKHVYVVTPHAHGGYNAVLIYEYVYVHSFLSCVRVMVVYVRVRTGTQHRCE